jgi:hypothetical protein
MRPVDLGVGFHHGCWLSFGRSEIVLLLDSPQQQFGKMTAELRALFVGQGKPQLMQTYFFLRDRRPRLRCLGGASRWQNLAISNNRIASSRGVLTNTGNASRGMSVELSGMAAFFPDGNCTNPHDSSLRQKQSRNVASEPPTLPRFLVIFTGRPMYRKSESKASAFCGMSQRNHE